MSIHQTKEIVKKKSVIRGFSIRYFYFNLYLRETPSEDFIV